MLQWKKATAWMLGAVLVAQLVTGCAGGTQDAPSSPPNNEAARFDAFLQDAFVEACGSNLIDLHFLLRDPAAFGVTQVEPTLGRLEVEQAAEQEKELDEREAQLKKFNPRQLTGSQRTTYDTLRWYYNLQQQYDGLTYYQELNTPTGLHGVLPTLLGEYRFYKREDIDQYLLLVEDVDDFMADLLAFQQERSRQGLFMADFALDNLTASLQNILTDSSESSLVLSFDERLKSFEGLTDQEREAYQASNRKAVETVVFPAYQAFLEGMEALRGTGVNQGGLCHLKRGDDYFKALVASRTGSSRSIKEIDELLDQGIAMCYEQVRRIVEENPQALEQLDTSCALSDPQEILRDLQEKIAQDFPTLNQVEYQIKTVSPALQDSLAPAFYLTPPMDQSTENRIYINPKYMDGDRLYLYTTLAHEGYPGHLYQNNYYLQQEMVPIRHMMNFLGYQEGWATYAEMASYWYAPVEQPDGAKLQGINRLLNILLNCKVDIGVNGYGWNEEQLAAFLSQFGLEGEKEITTFFQMVVEDPADHLSYGVGCLEFFELREQATLELGEQFNAKDFHHAVLEVGPAPFSVVKKAVEHYISTTLEQNSVASSASTTQSSQQAA